jgi:hypothetical protein
MPGTVRFENFDNASKKGWLHADIQGCLATGLIVSFMMSLIDVVIETAFNLPPHTIINMMGMEWFIIAWTGISELIGFIIVFVFRYNMIVIGPQRKFRYFCRWL